MDAYFPKPTNPRLFMNKITTAFYVLLLIAIMPVVSCKKDADNKQGISTPAEGLLALSDDEIASIAFAEPKELTPEMVLTIARNFEDSISKTPLSKGTSQPTFKITGKSYFDAKGRSIALPTKSTDATTIPVFNVAINSGKKTRVAVVSGDERMPLVIAYTGQIKQDDPLLAISRLALIEKVKEVEKLVDSLYTPTIKKLQQQFGTLPDKHVYEYVKNKIVSKHAIPGTKSRKEIGALSGIISQIGPLTMTEWDQSDPFNELMDVGNCDYDGERYPAGCFVIAAAQVQAYYRPALNINYSGNVVPIQWDPILVDPWGGDLSSNHLTSFIKHVFVACETTYNCEGSSTTDTKGINYLKQTLSMGSTTNMTDVKSSLDQLKLVLVTGHRQVTGGGTAGHAWVVDGYAVTRLKPGESIVGNAVWQRYNMYVHCNLGWGGGGTGYYLVGKDATGYLTYEPYVGREYNLNIKYYHNITKL